MAKNKAFPGNLCQGLRYSFVFWGLRLLCNRSSKLKIRQLRCQQEPGSPARLASQNDWKFCQIAQDLVTPAAVRHQTMLLDSTLEPNQVLFFHLKSKLCV
jgi:hypothetical protein